MFAPSPICFFSGSSGQTPRAAPQPAYAYSHWHKKSAFLAALRDRGLPPDRSAILEQPPLAQRVAATGRCDFDDLGAEIGECLHAGSLAIASFTQNFHHLARLKKVRFEAWSPMTRRLAPRRELLKPLEGVDSDVHSLDLRLLLCRAMNTPAAIPSTLI